MKNLLLTALAVFFCSCSKLADIKPSELDYFPTSKDSKWEHIWESNWANVISSGNSKNQALGDTMVDGKLYAMIGGSSNSLPVLVRKEDGKYYRRLEIYGNYGPERLFLKDNLPVGGSWTIQEAPDIKTVNTIVSKDQPRVIRGKEYKYTMEVKAESFIYIPNKNGYSLEDTFVSIYAKGVGLVEGSWNQSRLILIAYEIK